jgi:hypothetical protein
LIALCEFKFKFDGLGRGGGAPVGGTLGLGSEDNGIVIVDFSLLIGGVGVNRGGKFENVGVIGGEGAGRGGKFENVGVIGGVGAGRGGKFENVGVNGSVSGEAERIRFAILRASDNGIVGI